MSASGFHITWIQSHPHYKSNPISFLTQKIHSHRNKRQKRTPFTHLSQVKVFARKKSSWKQTKNQKINEIQVSLMSLHTPLQIKTHFSFFSGKSFPEKQTNKKELERAYSKITKGGHSVSSDSMEKYVSNGECTVLDSAILSLSLSLTSL